MAGSAFNPTCTTVGVGVTVTWTNNDGAIDHNVTFASSTSSGTLSGGQTFQRSFSAAGTYAYQCTFHAGMNGSVVVQ